jgi:hypothetical protein
MSIADTHEPAPIPNDRPAVWSLVIADMQARDAEGRRKYGTPLQPHNGRDALVDAYQEALDLVVYLRQAIEERKDETRQPRAVAEAKAFLEEGIIRSCGHPDPEEAWRILHRNADRARLVLAEALS